jgi:hypothetical protein
MASPANGFWEESGRWIESGPRSTFREEPARDVLSAGTGVIFFSLPQFSTLAARSIFRTRTFDHGLRWLEPNQHQEKPRMQKILSKAFFRIILPFVLAILLGTAELLEMEGRVRTNFFRPSLGMLAIPLFLVFLGIALRNTFRWSKEAEEYESDLKEAAEFERERRRRSTWIER